MSEPGNRPGPEEHLATMEANFGGAYPHKFLLVDDFVTRGSIITACGMMLKEAFPNSTIKAFAVVNTLGIGEKIDQIVEPRTGVIEYRDGDLNRGGWRDRILREKAASKFVSQSEISR